MPKFNRSVKVPGKSAEELYQRIAQDIDRFIEKGTLGVGSYDLKRNQDQKTVVVTHKLVTATLVCKENSLELEANLSIMALPFKSKIDEGINRWLEKTFQIKV